MRPHDHTVRSPGRGQAAGPGGGHTRSESADVEAGRRAADAFEMHIKCSASEAVCGLLNAAGAGLGLSMPEARSPAPRRVTTFITLRRRGRGRPSKTLFSTAGRSIERPPCGPEASLYRYIHKWKTWHQRVYYCTDNK
ncbi:hypothetical protein AK830_g11027 [Neonectria ditissima]|uniref:Uncharacterized protein n=1 Tax=Neonectria ditissima TaxID=78410 RepID=A0A0P7B961_9HYPO|nr:hypothetical protein AK830_g11027 [Neonectria ditissima]